MRLVLCSNVQQNGQIIIECCSKLLVWQRRKTFSFLCNNFVDFTHFVDYTGCAEASFLLQKKTLESASSHPAGQPINSSDLAVIPLDIYTSFAPSTDERASLNAGQQAMESVTNRSTRNIVRLSRRRKPSKRRKTRAHSGPDAIRAFGRAHPSPHVSKIASAIVSPLNVQVHQC